MFVCRLKKGHFPEKKTKPCTNFMISVLLTNYPQTKNKVKILTPRFYGFNLLLRFKRFSGNFHRVDISFTCIEQLVHSFIKSKFFYLHFVSNFKKSIFGQVIKSNHRYQRIKKDRKDNITEQHNTSTINILNRIVSLL